ncbi:MAG: penicillin-binding protein [Propionibacteriaceae bacterium]|jgi:cell division protein FtsI/penicillin-binding protein 2|nr:penicillin-binding protein [Propionibacteriaceae bacterium]
MAGNGGRRGGGVGRRGWLELVSTALVLVLALGGCGHDPSQPSAGLPTADPVLAELAQALGQLSLQDAPLAGSTAEAQAELDQIMKGMDGASPTVLPGALTYADDQPSAVGGLSFEWTWPSGVWLYESTVELRHDGEAWRALWSPSLIHPQLDSSNRLVHRRWPATRAGIVGDGGQPLIERYVVVDVGLDKTLVDPAQAEASARQLAELLQIDADRLVERVAQAGPKAFVTAITLRQDEVPSNITDIPGVRGVKDSALLGPKPGFMSEILGQLGPATADDIATSDGSVAAGDQVGQSGLQRRYDAQLRGVAGDSVYLRDRSAPPAEPDEIPPAQAVLHQQDPVAGQPLELSFNPSLQLKAEAVLATVGPSAAVVLIRPSDGAVLAAAQSPAAQGQAEANFGRYAPGSTFKIVTTLALLRHGLTPDSPVQCSRSANAGGLTMTNYSGYPSSQLGGISLTAAVAHSCNTAFVNEIGRLGDADLAQAAGSLGLGIDYDAGAPVFYGIVPRADSSAMKGQEVIGQGGVLVSPLAMAGVVASVAAGRTVVPWMVSQVRPSPTGAPLTETEAAQLRQVLQATVSLGAARSLQGVVLGAKTGTAEYGSGQPLPTHAWMVAYTDHDLAVAVWVHDGDSGSGVAGPLIRALLS